MADESATLEGQPAKHQRQDAPKGGAAPGLHTRDNSMRFTYATGARPLEGFTVKRGIGIGGFGQVYYAVSDAGKEVALKHIQRNLDVELRGVGQCLNLKHPNLLALYDIRYDEVGEGWVVMEYVAGESLRDVIHRNPNGMPHDQIAFWLIGAAAGTDCLHDHGIVHRDMKPGNIFNDAGIVKVGDYGLSKFISVSQHSAQTESVGTFHYMAPEIGRGRYGREIDVYALGIMLHEMLTGDVPFEGESSQEIIMKHLTAEPQLDDICEPYQTAIRRALIKDPDQRLSSVPEMLALLGVRLPELNVVPTIEVGQTSGVQESANEVQEAAKPEADESSMAAAAANPASTCEASADANETDEIIIAEEVKPEEAIYRNSEVESKPEVIAKAAEKTETIFIGDQTAEPNSEMEFGPVEHRLSNVPIQASSPAEQPLPSEPIARGLFALWGVCRDWFNNSAVSSLLKVGVIIVGLGAGIPLLVWNSYWAVPLLIILGVLYGFYYGIRAMILHAHRDEDSSENNTQHPTPRRWNEFARRQRTTRPLAQRLAELTGSLLLSGSIGGVLSIVTLIVAGESMTGDYQSWGTQLAWVALATICGAWSVLTLSKLWESHQGDQVLRRFAMLAAGLVIGALAYGVATSLYVNLEYGFVHQPSKLWNSWHLGGQPTLPAYLAYFGGLFAVLRWWLQADPWRASRLSLWAIVLCALWGFIIPFPQPWGIMIAMAISITVQLSSSWVNSDEKSRLRQRFRFGDTNV